MSEPLTPTFVNSVSVQGSLNGVCNILLSVACFLPDGEQVKVEAKPVVDLRFDLYCAQQIRDALDRILSEQTKTVNH